MDEKLNIEQKQKIIDNWTGNEIPHEESLMVNVYMLLFNEIPFIHELNIFAAGKYLKELQKKFKLTTVFEISKWSTYNKQRTEFKLLADIKNKIIITCTEDGCALSYCADWNKNVIDKYIEISKRYEPKKKKPRNKGRIFILTIIGSGKRERMAFSSFKLNDFEISIEQNYSDDFKSKSDEIIRRLKNKQDRGIVILHGESGTGKTFYLKHLCKVVGKKILYIPPALVEYIVSPAFIRMLGKHRNSVLVIEDADNILRKRDVNSNIQDVSSLLNITDGILNDILNLQIVTTFNTNISNIDEAFLRKGRLIAEHRFEKLSAKKAQDLSNSLGFKTAITEPMLLTDVYNQDVLFFKEKKTNGIGFKRQADIESGNGKLVQPNMSL